MAKVPKFRQFMGDSLDGLYSFFKGQGFRNWQDLQRVLKDLSFDDNFNGWIERDLSISAGSTVTIKNKIAPKIPRYRVILSSTQPQIHDGSNEWTTDKVYLKNDSGSDAIVTVAFLV